MSRPLIFEVLKTPAKAFGINKSARAVLIQLCDCYNPERNGSEVWPSLATIAELTGMDIKTVRAGRLALEQAGYIKIYIDHGKPDVCRINADVIREVTDPFQNGRAKLSTPLPKQVGVDDLEPLPKTVGVDGQTPTKTGRGPLPKQVPE